MFDNWQSLGEEALGRRAVLSFFPGQRTKWISDDSMHAAYTGTRSMWIIQPTTINALLLPPPKKKLTALCTDTIASPGCAEFSVVVF